MLTVEEREAQRRLEREKIREEIKRMREAQNYDIKKPAVSAKEIFGYFKTNSRIVILYSFRGYKNEKL